MPNDEHRARQLIRRVRHADRVLCIGCAANTEKEQSIHPFRTIADELEGTVTGIDVHEPGVNRLDSAGYDARVADAETFDLSKTFDAIIAGEVIEHLGDPGAMLRRCHDHLTPTGRLHITTPNPEAFCYVRRALLGGDRVRDHTAWFDPANIRRLARRRPTGLTVTDTVWVPPTGGVSGVLWWLGRERAAAPGHITTLARVDAIPETRDATGAADERVSVILPTYGDKAYLRDAIRGVVTQTYPDVELIVVDGDDCDWLRATCEAADWVRYVAAAPKGAAHARNVGLEAATGEIAMFCDADDWWTAEKVAREVWVLDEEDADMVWSDQYVTDSGVIA
jgi:SAM-dependent methyltransferase